MSKRRVEIIEANNGGFVIQITKMASKEGVGVIQYETETEVATSTDDLINKLNTLFPTEK